MRNWFSRARARFAGARQPWSARFTVEPLETRCLLSTVATDTTAHGSGCGCGMCSALRDFAGNEYYQLGQPDSSPGVEEGDGAAGGSATGSSNPVDFAQTFLLNSLPGANHTIYLDFTGHVTSGTVWNSSFTSGANIVTPAFDLDGNPAAFSDAELGRIQYIWQRVAEDYAPFGVNVTTRDPGLEALRKSSTSDTQWGVRAVIGGDGSWYGSAGGVAYVGSFNWNTDTPAFVFSSRMAGDEKYTAEAISHEVGHALGLDHDGTATSGYYQGSGGWAPVMGVGYYQNLVQFSRGEYSGANNTQDDLSIITTQNGFGYRTDDYGSTFSSASALSTAGGTVSGNGIIERNTDADVFGFYAQSGTLSFNVVPADRGANLDIKASLYDAAGNLVVTSNPTGALYASLSVTVGAGQYFLKIEGTGEGDPLNGGYSKYGSLGQYWFTGTVVDAGSVPSVSVSAVSASEGAGSMTFRLSLSAPAAGPVTVAYRTVDGTARAGSDYAATSGAVTFAAGESEKFVTVAVLNDALVEPTESFALEVSSGDGQPLTVAQQGVGTITDDDVLIPVISVNSVSKNEGNPVSGAASSTAFTFTIGLSAPTATSVTVSYATADGTAVAGSDYTATSGSVTFAPGETSKTVTVYVAGDRTVEANETFDLRLTGATGATITQAVGTGTIINDDIAPTISVSAVSASEGAGAMTFRLSLSAPAAGPVTVAYRTVDGTARAGSDYAATSGAVTFAAGEFEKFVTVAVLNDALVEPTESFALEVSSGDGQPLTVAQQGVGTITDDDVLIPVISVNSVSKNEGNPVSGAASSTAFTFTIGLSAPTATSVTVSYATADGTAVAGSDYTATSGSVTFAPGETSKTVTVYVAGDGTVEANETFDLRLTGTTLGTITQAVGTGTIVNDDVAPTVSVSSVSASEGAGAMTFRLSLSAPAAGPVTVAYRTVDGTARAGSDYAATSGAVTFAAGEFEKFVTVAVLNDALVEPTESFGLEVSSGDGQPLIVAQQGLGTILDDDVLIPVISVNSVSKNEGNPNKQGVSSSTAFTFTISLSEAVGNAVTVAYSTADGTAVAGSDYTATSGSVTFAAGETSKTVTVYVVGDGVVETNETFSFRITGVSGGSIGQGVGTGTIVNDDTSSTTTGKGNGNGNGNGNGKPSKAALPGEVDSPVTAAADVAAVTVAQAAGQPVAAPDAAPVAVTLARPDVVPIATVPVATVPVATLSVFFAPAVEIQVATLGASGGETRTAVREEAVDSVYDLLVPAASGQVVAGPELATEATAENGSPWDDLLSLDL